MTIHSDSVSDVTPTRVPRRLESPSLVARLARAPELGAAVAAILLYIFFSIAAAGNGFTSISGTASWLNTAAQLGIIAVPVGMLMIAGEFDLSIGSMVGAGSVTVGIVTGYYGQPLLFGLAIAFCVAMIGGLGNGLLVTRTGVPSFIVTLASNFIIAGLALAISRSMVNSTSIQVQSDGLVSEALAMHWGDFDVAILWWLGIIAVAAWVLGQKQFGNWMFATGGDAEQARRAGVPTAWVKIVLYLCTALASAFVGALQAVQFHTGDATTGQGYVFQAPMVVVIGGVLLLGGYGTVLGVVLGTLIYGFVSAGLFYTGWNTDYAQVVIGVLMVIAVLANSAVRRTAANTFRTNGARGANR
ncbi:ABC transporter permease [Mesorhizobium sp. M1163]|uniref:ABC transporter permease n=1 Tax=Mesorhizobium sp. M1163 TaxID=2957065 RepID=UPI00333BB7EF